MDNGYWIELESGHSEMNRPELANTPGMEPIPTTGRIRWQAKRPTPGDSMTCMAMYMSGSRDDMIIIRIRRLSTPEDPIRVHTESPGVAPGTSLRVGRVVPFVSCVARNTAIRVSDFVVSNL